MTTSILRHPNTEHDRIEIHVLPADFDGERALALKQRYLESIDAGQHPPFRYIALVFGEIDQLLQVRRAEAGITR